MSDDSPLAPACQRVGRWWRGCKFEGRWDSYSPNVEGVQPYQAAILSGLVQAATSRVYVHDVCVRCGRMVKR